MDTRAHGHRPVRHPQARRRIAAAVLSLVAGVLLALLAVSPALGHAELESSDPENKAKLETPPTVVELTFTEGLDAGKSSFTLKGPDGDVGKGTASKNGSRTMTLEGLTLAAGAYTISWTAAADDGHIERGKLAFTVLVPTPAPPTAAPAPTAAPSVGAGAVPSAAPTADASPSVAPTLAPEPSPDIDPEPAASGGDVLLPILAGLLLVALIGFLVLRRGRPA